MVQIINSLLDTDQYKISMLYFVWKNAPNAKVKYRFVCRNHDVKLGFLQEKVRQEVLDMCNLRFTSEEINYLKKLRYLSNNYTDYSFFDFLENYDLGNRNNNILLWSENGDLNIEIEGLWINTILYEVPVLAIVNELYFQHVLEESTGTKFENYEKNGMMILDEKIDFVKNHPMKDYFKFCEFGTRRRFSGNWQDKVLVKLKDELPKNLVGTSNLYLANKYNLTAIGTHAHEVVSGYLGMVDRIETAQRAFLYLWMAQYDTNQGPDLGIALSDTFTVDAFLRDFRKGIASAYRGVRHDSGDPFEFGEKIIKHYEMLDIDPKTKTIIFSDGLDFELAFRILERFHGRIDVSFGIGTNLSNDVGFKPLNIVMKLVECNGRQCVKLSDNPSKAIGDPEMVEKVKKAYGVI